MTHTNTHKCKERRIQKSLIVNSIQRTSTIRWFAFLVLYTLRRGTFLKTETRRVVVLSPIPSCFLLLVWQGPNGTPSHFWLMHSALSSSYCRLLVISTSPIRSITVEEYWRQWRLPSWPHPLVGNVLIPIRICQTIFHFHEKVIRPVESRERFKQKHFPIDEKYVLHGIWGSNWM